MAHPNRQRSSSELKMIERVQQLTSQWQGVSCEVDGFGHTTFRVGKKSFVIIGAGQEGGGSMSIKCDLATQDSLVRGGRYSRTPYIGQHGWVSTLSGGKLDWLEVGELLEDAYRSVAPKRYLKDLKK